MNSNNWISNLLPAAKNEDGSINPVDGGGVAGSTGSERNPESVSSKQSSKEPSPANTPLHQIRQSEATGPLHSPQKPVNLLPEVPETNALGRKLSDREKRDCEVIGKGALIKTKIQQKLISLTSF